jgi:hypothetical protein
MPRDGVSGLLRSGHVPRKKSNCSQIRTKIAKEPNI